MYELHKNPHLANKYGSVKERLKSTKIKYRTAGENTAGNYLDGPAVVEAWLNSDAHRANILNKHFTNLGAGVFQNYYTEDFIQK